VLLANPRCLLPGTTLNRRVCRHMRRSSAATVRRAFTPVKDGHNNWPHDWPRSIGLLQRAALSPRAGPQGDPRTTLPTPRRGSGYGLPARLPRWPIRPRPALAELVDRRGLERASEVLIRWG
jgi:hypothetical protein